MTIVALFIQARFAPLSDKIKRTRGQEHQANSLGAAALSRRKIIGCRLSRRTFFKHGNWIGSLPGTNLHTELCSAQAKLCNCQVYDPKLVRFYKYNLSLLPESDGFTFQELESRLSSTIADSISRAILQIQPRFCYSRPTQSHIEGSSSFFASIISFDDSFSASSCFSNNSTESL